MIKVNSTLIRNNKILCTAIDNEVGMLDVEQGRYYGLDSIGSQIWQYLEKQWTVEDLITKLMEDYEVDKEVCTVDVLELLNQLYDRGLIQTVHC